ncbi:proton channel OTOP2-like [Stegostoma tigrinum]|uniref:proton channel OTOP2-like n=1 Tax=Stegostoma tigrinum TaxID=3053191 RepID=UPI002870222B|nr:proton channel OTOP2-like [Stegostoma tigrinum]
MAQYRGQDPFSGTGHNIEDKAQYQGQGPTSRTRLSIGDRAQHWGQDPTLGTGPNIGDRAQHQGQGSASGTGPSIGDKTQHQGQGPISGTGPNIKNKAQHWGQGPASRTRPSIRNRAQYRGQGPTSRTRLNIRDRAQHWRQGLTSGTGPNIGNKAQPKLVLVFQNLLSLAAEMIRGGERTNEAATSQLELEYGPGKGPNSPEPVQSGALESSRQGPRLLSCLVAVNVLCLGIALICAGAFREVPVRHNAVLLSLTVVMGLTAGWMLSYVLCTARRKRVIVYKDPHAGPVWLRGGLLLFGACSLLLDVFKIVHVAGFKGCEHPVKFVFPITQLLFTFMQSYFLWVHSKDCIQLHQDIARFGLALSLVCNLLLWMEAVTEESIHQTGSVGEKHPENRSHAHTDGVDEGCFCSTNVCLIFQTGYYYLYPFNIEYSLFASAMLGVMWKNVGRLIEEQDHPAHLQLRFHGLLLGPSLGTAEILIGLAIFILYEVEVTDEGGQSWALTAYYLFNIVALALTSISALVGFCVHQFERRGINRDKNPARHLDMALLLWAALGQFLISYFSLVAIVSIQPFELLNTLNLLFSILTIAQHILQNAFIAEGLSRKPFVEGSHPDVMTSNSDGHANNHCIPGDAIAYCIQNTLSQISSTPSGITVDQETVSSHLESVSHIQEGQHSVPTNRLSSKRRILKEVSAFLLLSNVIFWILPAFGARPHFANGLEEKFYGFQLWATVVNIGLPLGIFYRMHSATCLLEVYLIS